MSTPALPPRPGSIAAAASAGGAAGGATNALARAATDSDDEEDDVEQLQYKIVVLGNGAVGKTSLIHRFTNNEFSTSYKQTIGLDFFIKRIILPGERFVNLQIWDIGGQTLGSKMIGNYIYGAQAVILTYDVTNYQSFQDLEDWLSLVRRTFNNEPLPYIAIVGNKTDLLHVRVVKADDHIAFATAQNLNGSFLLSAKANDRVVSTFTQIAADLAGVELNRADRDVLEVREGRVVEAAIVNHAQHVPQEATLHERVEQSAKKKDNKCVVM